MCIRTCGATWVYIFVVRVLHMVSEQHVTVPGVRCGRASVVWVLGLLQRTRRDALPCPPAHTRSRVDSDFAGRFLSVPRDIVHTTFEKGNQERLH